MRFRIVQLSVPFLVAVPVALADEFYWMVDSAQSSLTTTISATAGVTLSDTETNHVAGFVAGSLALPAYPFTAIHLTSADLSYTSNPTFNLTQPFIGGATIVGSGLGFATPGPNGLGFASPTPAAVDLAGAFAQPGNGAEGRGTLTYTGSGILGASIGSGTINLLDQSPLPLDLSGTITQSGDQLLLNAPVSLDQSTVQNGITIRVQVNGSVIAKARTTAGGWKADADGNWLTDANWSSGVAPLDLTPISTAVLGAVITSPRTITVPSPGARRVNKLLIDSPVAYHIAGAVAPRTLEVHRGMDHTIGELSYGAAAVVDISAEASVRVDHLTFSNYTLTKTGAGTLHVVAGYSGPLVIQSGTLTLQTNLRATDSITIQSGARLDVGEAGLQIDYTGAAAITPTLAATRALIARGYAGGTWTGDGIVSAAVAPASDRAIGYGDSEALGIGGWGGRGATTAILIGVTLKGDADLDFDVDFDDLLSLAQHYGSSGFWSDGDFNYDGVVGFDDLLGLAQQYGSTLSVSQQSHLSPDFAADFALAQSLVPEPTMALALPLLAGRRRRGS